MAFFHFGDKIKKTTTKKGGYSLDFIHRNECQVCPLNRCKAHTPKMEPDGSDQPVVYMLGGGPSHIDDEAGVPFQGRGGELVRAHIPHAWLNDVRWNNVVRDARPESRPPAELEIEACRPSIVRDIEATKPQAIAGFGNVALQWATGRSGAYAWSGTQIPVKIGEHTCWFFPMQDPETVVLQRRFEPRSLKDYPSEEEFVFALDMRRLFRKLEKLPEPTVHTTEDALSNITFGTDVAQIQQFLDQAARLDLVGLDYETNMLRPYSSDAKILTAAISTPTATMAFPLDHPEAPWSEKERDRLDKIFALWLHKAKCRKVVHQLAFEMEWSGVMYGVDCLHESHWGCSLGQAFILGSRRGTLGLDDLTLQFFGIDIKAISNTDRKNLEQTDLETVLSYNGVDSKYHLACFREQHDLLVQEGTYRVYNEHVRRIPAAVLTQIKGVPVDQKVTAELHAQLTSNEKNIEAQIADLDEIKHFKTKNGRPFQPSRPKDLKEVLSRIGIFPEKYDETELSKFDHPLCELILKWREQHKLLSTYVEPTMPGSKLVDEQGLIHPILNIAKTRTWRTSSEEPNIQNYPKHQHKEVRSQVRKAGEKVVTFDYAGIQARNVAMESKDRRLVEAFWNHYDIHSDWMLRILRHEPRWADGTIIARAERPNASKEDKDYRKHFRQQAKNLFVFPRFFGAVAKSVAGYLGISEFAAEGVTEEFKAAFPEVDFWHTDLKAFYKKHGYVTGLSEFRRYAPVSVTEQINTPIQGDESAIVINAMCKLSERGLWAVQPNIELHDDLTFIWPEKKIDTYAPIVLQAMLEIDYEWVEIVPLEVEMSVGDDWASIKEVGKFESVGTDSYKEIK